MLASEARADDDEPVFVLRSTDKFAPLLIDMWCNLVILERGIGTDTVTEALDLVEEMRAWQEEHPGKVKAPG